MVFIIFALAIAIVGVVKYLQKFNLEYKAANYKMLKEISDYEILCDQLSKLSDAEMEKLIEEFKAEFL